MAIETQCEHCGFTYISKDEMAGKKVRCRNCGQIFAIRAPAMDDPGGTSAGQIPSDPGDEPFADLSQIEPSAESPYNPNRLGETRRMPVVTKFESNMEGGVGSAKSFMERTGDAEAFDLAGPQPGELRRPSLPFSFPYAGDLDTWLPRLVPLLMLFWFFNTIWNWRPDPETADTYPTWSGLIPIGLLLALLLVVWTPIFSGAMGRVAAAMNFCLPPKRGIRALCLASVPFGLGGVFWLAGESTVTMGIGLFIGAAITVPGAWFFYRLRENEIAHAAVAMVLATAISAGITVGAFAGGNYVLNQILNSTDKGDLFTQSPMGPNLPWEAAPAKASAPVATKTPTPPPPPTTKIVLAPEGSVARTEDQPPTTSAPEEPQPDEQPGAQQPAAADGGGILKEEAPETPNVDTLPAATPPAASASQEQRNVIKPDHPIFASGHYLPVQQAITDVIYPIGESNFFAVVSPTDDPEIQEVSLYTVQPFARVAQARFASTVQESGYALSPDGKLLVRVTHFGDAASLQVFDFAQNRVTVNQPMGDRGSEPRLRGFLSNTTILMEWRSSQAGEPYTLRSLDLGNLRWQVYALSNERHAETIVAMPDMRSVVAVGVDADSTVTLRFWEPDRRDDRRNRMTRVMLMEFRGEFSLSPTGIAVRPDGQRIAVTYGDNRQLQLLVCERDDRRGPVLNHIFPALPQRADSRGKRPQNRLTWLPGGDVVVYGQFCIDTVTGEVLGDIDIGPIMQQQLVSDEILHLVISTQQGPRVLQVQLRENRAGDDETTDAQPQANRQTQR